MLWVSNHLWYSMQASDYHSNKPQVTQVGSSLVYFVPCVYQIFIVTFQERQFMLQKYSAIICSSDDVFSWGGC